MGCVSGQRLLPWYLALVCLTGILGTADAECDAACSQNCFKQITDCTAHLKELWNIPYPSACFAANIEFCSKYRTSAQCHDGMPPVCLSIASVKEKVDWMKENLTYACSKDLSCQNTFLKCPCKVTGTGAHEEFAVERFCTQVTPFAQCEASLPADCSQYVPEVMKSSYSKVSLEVDQYLYCTSSGGCGPAVTCLHQAANPQAKEFSSFSPGLPNLPNIADLIGFDNVCWRSSVFDCLKTSTSTCKLDQGGTSMDQIKTAVTEQCQVWQRTNTYCPLFHDCVKAVLPPFLENDNPTEKEVQARGYYIASAFRSGFWCVWIKHNYQCMLKHTAACVIDGIVSVLTLQEKLRVLEITCQGAATAPAPPNFDPTDMFRGAQGATSIQPTVSLLITSLLISITLFLAVVL